MSRLRAISRGASRLRCSALKLSSLSVPRREMAFEKRADARWTSLVVGNHQGSKEHAANAEMNENISGLAPIMIELHL